MNRGAGARIGAMDDYGKMPHEVAGRLRRDDVVRLFKKGAERSGHPDK